MNGDLNNYISALRRRLNKQAGMNNQNSFHGTDVKKIRQTLSQFCHFKITQPIFAKVMGFQPAMVKLWEAGLAKPSPRAITKMSHVRQHPKQMLLILQGNGYIK